MIGTTLMHFNETETKSAYKEGGHHGYTERWKELIPKSIVLAVSGDVCLRLGEKTCIHY